MSEKEELELPRASYDLFSNIVRGFLAAHGDETPVSTKKIARFVGRHPTIISQNIKAITSLGIASRLKGYNYILTKEGVDLAYSIEYNDKEGISAAFRSLISKNEFLRSLIFSVKSRGSISNFDLRDDIGKRAQVTKNDQRATVGSQTIIDILVISDYLKKEGDEITTTERATEFLKEGISEAPPKIKPVKKKTEQSMGAITVAIDEKEIIPIEIQIRLNFQVPLQPNESEINSITETIRKIRDSLQDNNKEE